ADDQRPVEQLGMVALLDAGVEGIAIDMGERQRSEFVMGDKARRAAGAAAPARRRRLGEHGAIATQHRHGASSAPHSQAAPRTPLASPWRGGTSCVAMWSENT